MAGRRTFLITVVCLLGVLCVGGSAQAAQTSFRNPVLPQSATGEDSPDPWIFLQGGRYWLTYTTGDHIEVRSAPTLSGLASARPKHLWPPAVRAEPQSRCCQVWAPEIHRLQGPDGVRWYVYYAANTEGFTHRLYVLESRGSSPAGPYHFKGRLALPQPYAIDGTVAEIRGRLYLLYSGGESFTPASIYLSRLANPWTTKGRPIEISKPTLPWESVTFPIDEGPEVLMHGGKLNVIFSASWCGSGEYALGRLTVPKRARLMDPATWAGAKLPTPVFEGSPARGVYGPGHGSFFTSPNGHQSWMVYHATEDTRGCFTGGLRTTRAQRFTWNRDGTPDFGKPVSLSTDIAAPGGDHTITFQAESSPLHPGNRADRVDNRQLYGYAGMSLQPAGRKHALPTMRFHIRRAGRYKMYLRVLAEPTSARVALSERGRSVTRKVRRPGEKAIELSMGTWRLKSGRHRLRLRSAGPLTVDQLRLQPAR